MNADCLFTILCSFCIFCNTEPLTNQGQVDLKSLIPVLNEADGYYQIGPVKTCSELFVLSVTIAYAGNLSQVRMLVIE